MTIDELWKKQTKVLLLPITFEDCDIDMELLREVLIDVCEDSGMKNFTLQREKILENDGEWDN